MNADNKHFYDSVGVSSVCYFDAQNVDFSVKDRQAEALVF
jgi:hypothetical protein